MQMNVEAEVEKLTAFIAAECSLVRGYDLFSVAVMKHVSLLALYVVTSRQRSKPEELIDEYLQSMKGSSAPPLSSIAYTILQTRNVRGAILRYLTLQGNILAAKSSLTTTEKSTTLDLF